MMYCFHLFNLPQIHNQIQWLCDNALSIVILLAI